MNKGAQEEWTLTPVAHRGGIVEELDIKMECSDGRSGVVTIMRWPAGWRVPLYLNLRPKMERALLTLARETVGA